MFYSVGYLTGFISGLGMGIFVGLAQPKKPEARLWALLSFLVAEWSLGRFMILHVASAEDAFFWQRLMYVGAIYLNIVYFHFVLAFVREQKMKGFLYIGYAVATILVIINLTTHLFVRGMLREFPYNYYEQAGRFYPVHVFLYLLYPGMGVLQLLRGWVHSRDARRNQIGYVVMATAFGFLCGATTIPLIFGLSIPPLGGPLVPIYLFIMTYAILKHRLLDIKVVIRKTLLYSFVTAALAALYGGSVTLLARLIETQALSNAFLPSVILNWLAIVLRDSFNASCVATSLVSVGFGLFVFFKGLRQPVHLMWCMACLSVGAWSIGQGNTGTSTNPQQAMFWLVWYEHLGAILIPAFFFHFVTLILAIRRPKILAAVYTMAGILEILNISKLLFSAKPTLFFNYDAIPSPLYSLFESYFFGVWAYSFILLFVYMRRTRGQLKNQLKYIFIGNIIAFCGGSTTFLPFYVNVFPYGMHVVPMYVVMMSYAIYKHQLMDINVVIRKTLLYSLVSAALASVYVGTITLVAHILEGRKGPASAISSALAAVFITVLFNPLRNRLQVFIDRKFSRSRVVAGEQLVKLSSEVIGHENLEKIADSAGRILEEAVHPQIWALYLRAEDDKQFIKIVSTRALALPESMPLVNEWSNYFLAAPAPVFPPSSANEARSGIVLGVPLMGGRDLLGYLLLGEKQSEELYTNEELELLRIVANQAAVAFERSKMAQQISGAFVHEIKMPLANIALPAELTFMDMDDLAEGKKSAQELIPGIKKRMKYIMDQALLAGSRVDAVRENTVAESIRKGQVDFRKVLESSLQQMEGFLTQAQVTVHQEIPQTLPLIPGSARQLEIVFANLIKNAAEAMNQLVSSRELHIRVVEEETSLMAHVRDTGNGVPLEARPFLFTSRFTTKGTHGSGVGLYLSRQIVEVHGGTIEMQSENGSGTQFIVRLPKK
jgi:signal transduction histidine kinase